jgi:WD40 repeat protein
MKQFQHLTRWSSVLALALLTVLFSACGGSKAASNPPASTTAPTQPAPTPTTGVSGNSLFKTLAGHGKAVVSVAFSPDGKTLASASKDGTIRLWDVTTGQNLKTLNVPGVTGAFNGVAFSPDGTLLAGASDDASAYIWDVASGQLSMTLSDANNPLEAVAFSPDGTLLAGGSSDENVYFWDVASGQLIRHVFTGDYNGVSSVAFSPDGKTLAVTNGENGSVLLLDVATGQKGKTLASPDQTVVIYIAWSPDGKTIAGSNGNNVALWNAATGQVIKTLNGPNNYAEGVAFSPDSQTLAAGYAADDDSVHLWNLALGVPLPSLHGHSDTVNTVAFSPDGKLLASGSDDHTVRIWQLG